MHQTRHKHGRCSYLSDGICGDSQSLLEPEPLRSKDRGLSFYNIDDRQLYECTFHVDRWMDGRTGRQTDGQTDRQRLWQGVLIRLMREESTQRDSATDPIRTSPATERQTYRRTDGRTDGRMDRQTENVARCTDPSYV